MVKDSNVFRVGKRVEEAGYYLCVPCGYKRYFKEGSKFPPCLGCMKDVKRRFRKGFELWEKV